MARGSRWPIVAANWKMNLTSKEVGPYCSTLRSGLPRVSNVEVVLFPPFPLLWPLGQALAGSAVAWGGQDLHPETRGAHTGDVSGRQLVDAGSRWVICGHSERRRDHGESDELVARKVRAARDAGLVPLLCLGESAAERRCGRTFEVLRRQLAAVLEVEPSALELAYEPVWAIGTGETATPELAQEAHVFLRSELVAAIGEERAAAVRILYGGSVNRINAGCLIAEADVDGFLVGGASLDADEFLDIIAVCGERT